MARKRDDSVKPGCGIDGSKGENFTKRGSDPWNPPVLTDDLNPAADAAAKYSSNDDAGLRRTKMDPQNYPSIDIWDLADSQSGRTGPARLRKRDQE